MTIVRNVSFRAASLAHFGVDLLNSQRSIYLTYLSLPLGLSNAAIGLVGTLYSLTGSLSQPFFGNLADRYGARWLSALGVFWMGLMFALAVTNPGTSALIFLILAALGSAAVHPAGVMHASMMGRLSDNSQEATATSVFFVFGQAGLSLGPAIGGALLALWGPEGLLLLVVMVLPLGVNAAIRIPGREEHERTEKEVVLRAVEVSRITLVMFAIVIAARAWTQMNMVFFLPKYYSDLGAGPAQYGLITAVYMGAATFGGVIGGWQSDRTGPARVVIVGMVGAAIAIYLIPLVAQSSIALAVILLAGAFAGMPSSVLVVRAQRLMPHRTGAVSGAVLGFTFAAGSIGTFFSGIIADQFGFEVFFRSTALIAGIGAVFAMILGSAKSSPLNPHSY